MAKLGSVPGDDPEPNAGRKPAWSVAATPGQPPGKPDEMLTRRKLADIALAMLNVSGAAAMSNLPQKSVPGIASTPPGFAQRFASLSACHDRVQRSLLLLVQLQRHIGACSIDDQARRDAADVRQYFSHVARKHHEDEERYIVDVLQDSKDVKWRAAAMRIVVDHIQLRSAWADLAPLLGKIESGQEPHRAHFAQAVARFVRLHQEHLRLEYLVAFPAALAHKLARKYDSLSKIALLGVAGNSCQISTGSGGVPVPRRLSGDASA